MTLQIAGSILLLAALVLIAWPVIREGRRFYGKRRVIRTLAAGVLLVAGAALLLAPRVISDGLWALMPDRALIGAMDDVTTPDDHRFVLLKRRLGAGAVEPADLRHLCARTDARLRAADDPTTWRLMTILLDGLEIDHDGLTDTWLAGLQADAPGIREEAAYALGTFLPDEARAVPALAKATDAGEHSVRALCAWALWQYARDGELNVAGMNALHALLFDPAPNVRFQAALSLGPVVDDPARLITPLTEGLTSPDPLTQLRAIGALQALGPESRAALPTLKVLRHADNDSLSLAAEKAIARITAVADAD